MHIICEIHIFITNYPLHVSVFVWETIVLFAQKLYTV